jgi:Tfp pilus assembly protein PilF
MSIYEARRNASLENPTQSLATWLAGHPDDSAVRRLYAQALTLQGDIAGAAREYEKVLASYPAEAGSLNNLAWLYHQQRDPRALETSRKAWIAAPKVPEVADTHGWLLVEAGAVEQGLALLKDADAAAGARQPEIRYHYAAALARAGKRPEAVALLQDLLVNGGPFPAREPASALLKSLAG